jgi:hypothetical protein
LTRTREEPPCIVAYPLRVVGDLAATLGIGYELRPERPLDVADEILDTVVADRHPEVLCRDILELMCLIDDRIRAAWDHFAKCAPPHGGIRAEEMVVDDDHVGFGGALPHPHDEAVVVARALGPDAVVGRRRNLVPERQVFRKVFDFRAIARLGLVRPLLEDPDVDGFVERADRGTLAEGLESVEAEIVAAALHAGRLERDAERLLEDRQILEEDLLLQILGARGDKHSLTAENRGHEVGERFSRARAGLGEQHAAIGEDHCHGVRHLELPGAWLESIERAREGAVGRKGRDRGLAQLRGSG